MIVINDEAHHCYRREARGRRGQADRRRAARMPKPATKRPESRSTGIEAIKAKLGVLASSTISAQRRSSCRGSGYSEGTLFPWVVSDFSLIDAIESGIVKVPRVPVFG